MRLPSVSFGRCPNLLAINPALALSFSLKHSDKHIRGHMGVDSCELPLYGFAILDKASGALASPLLL